MILHGRPRTLARMAIACTLAVQGVVLAQGPAPLTLDRLVRMDAGSLDAIYRGGEPGPIPDGRVRGRVLYPDKAFAAGRSGAARLVWQGKVFDAGSGMASNKFFGMKAVKARVGCGPSWRDGAPAIILDYQGTSAVYADVRDEIRRVAPGLYLGLMYGRSTPCPDFKMYFALQDCP